MTTIQTYRIIVGGRIQGVGYRPFVYRLAKQHQLTGSVHNHGGDVHILAQGSAENLAAFTRALVQQAPQIARPRVLEHTKIEKQDLPAFTIDLSVTPDSMNVHVPPDYFTCPACLMELADPADRRFDYPFINCTECGPRYTIIRALPYDRVNTTMAGFTLCANCAREYADPDNRRFHAEPVACPVCGPQLALQSTHPSATTQALNAMLDLLQQGEIVSIKGIGGYHLCCDATNAQAIRRLRERKPRPHKPLALLIGEAGSDGLDMVREYFEPSAQHAELLRAPSRPIVLLTPHSSADLPPEIAPGLNEVGVMLPYSPLHHLLLTKFGRPLIATSANISGEPVLTDHTQVQTRLAHITSHHLHHNRPIQRPADDSVWFINAGEPCPLRLGRGHSPLELTLPCTLHTPLLACGGHMKNTVALAWSNRIVISPHIGDLESPRSREIFQQCIADLQQLYAVIPEVYVCDAHPGYASTRWAKQQATHLSVYHHHAHASCVAGEYAHETKWLVFTWDGVGYGEHGELWGGEALYGQAGGWQRVASWRRFHLPGGDKAAREPWRSALAVSWESGGNWPQAPGDTELLHRAWQQKRNCPASSAVGRLFDAAAALTGICVSATFEAQAPMYLEQAARHGRGEAIPLPLTHDIDQVYRHDWQALLPLLTDTGLRVEDRAFIFHNTLAEALCAQAKALRAQHGEFAVGLCGGVFQNRLLTELVWDKLTQAGFRVYLPRQIPVNDGGLCYGQIIEAAAILVQTPRA